MSTKQQRLPVQVTSWMEKDITLRKVAANPRLMTNDTRQNIVLSRRFFASMFGLSIERHRKINEMDRSQRSFLRQQAKKSETTLPGLRPYVDKILIGRNELELIKRDITPATASNSAFFSPSSTTLMSPFESKSDPSFNRHREVLQREKTVNQYTSKSELLPQRKHRHNQPVASRRRLNQLALPKGARINPAGTAHIRRQGDSTISGTELFSESNEEIFPYTFPSAKPNKTLNDSRYHKLVESFAEVHRPAGNVHQSIEQIVRSNPSLQDSEGRLGSNDRENREHKVEQRQQRQALIKQLNKGIDIFLIEVAV